jgi:hypothetical protein
MTMFKLQYRGLLVLPTSTRLLSLVRSVLYSWNLPNAMSLREEVLGRALIRYWEGQDDRMSKGVKDE